MFSFGSTLSKTRDYWRRRGTLMRMMWFRLRQKSSVLRTYVRMLALNHRTGVKIDTSTSLDPRAIIDMEGDGFGGGGIVVIGARCRLGTGVILSPYGGKIQLGKHVYVGPYSVIYGHGGVTIGDDVLIAAHCVIIPANHTWTDLERPIFSHPVTTIGIEIQDGVWLGTGVKILDGVVIGRGTVVGAGAVVTKSLPPMVIALGVPARIVGPRDPR